MRALIFDCDGVLAETERDGHRAAFNRMFAAEGLDFEWTEDDYASVLSVAGGRSDCAGYAPTRSWSDTGYRPSRQHLMSSWRCGIDARRRFSWTSSPRGGCHLAPASDASLLGRAPLGGV